jgi:energy-converting hydrogenase Eha subunit H
MHIKKINLLLVFFVILFILIILYLAKTEKQITINKNFRCELPIKVGRFV